MADNASDIRTDLDRLKTELGKLRQDFGGLAEAALDLGKDSAGSAKEKLEAGVAELKKAAAAAKAKGGEAVEVAQDYVKERPLTSVLVAFGAGLLIAKLLDRK